MTTQQLVSPPRLERIAATIADALGELSVYRYNAAATKARHAAALLDLACIYSGAGPDDPTRAAALELRRGACWCDEDQTPTSHQEIRAAWQSARDRLSAR